LDMTAVRRPVALITGAGRRLGRALALDFGRRGWSVAVHVRTASADADALAAEISAQGGKAHVFPADLADERAVAALVPKVVAVLGAPRCLVNNASMFRYDDITSLDSELWDKHLAVNLTAPVFLTKALADQLPPADTGAVINILDQRVWKPTPHFLSYAGSKSALWAMTPMLAQALAPRIRVNAIGPGPMLKSVHQTEDDFRRQYEATPLKRPTSVDEVAAAIDFILKAPAMTGQMIALDGGQHLTWQTPDIGDGRG
jgi:NAD(P)-dependent dehydrogenase (short-subunit alcohol dehydrogenase family)